MEIIKIIGIALISLVIIIILKQYKPEFALYVSLIAGVIIVALSLDKLNGVINLLSNIASRANINTEMIKILIKITGITILTEFAISVCNDSGETAIANKVDLGSKVIIIAMSIPIISTVLETLIKILP